MRYCVIGVRHATPGSKNVHVWLKIGHIHPFDQTNLNKNDVPAEHVILSF
jgi:hypothetical protein